MTTYRYTHRSVTSILKQSPSTYTQYYTHCTQAHQQHKSGFIQDCISTLYDKTSLLCLTDSNVRLYVHFSSKLMLVVTFLDTILFFRNSIQLHPSERVRSDWTGCGSHTPSGQPAEADAQTQHSHWWVFCDFSEKRRNVASKCN